jgi:hypothetical protein
MANDLPRVTSIVVAVTLLARIAPCAAPGGGRPEAAGPEAARVRMVEEQIAARGIADPAVLRAMRTVPRHEFVPARARAAEREKEAQRGRLPRDPQKATRSLASSSRCRWT